MDINQLEEGMFVFDPSPNELLHGVWQVILSRFSICLSRKVNRRYLMRTSENHVIGNLRSASDVEILQARLQGW